MAHTPKHRVPKMANANSKDRATAAHVRRGSAPVTVMGAAKTVPKMANGATAHVRSSHKANNLKMERLVHKRHSPHARNVRRLIVHLANAGTIKRSTTAHKANVRSLVTAASTHKVSIRVMIIVRKPVVRLANGLRMAHRVHKRHNLPVIIIARMVSVRTVTVKRGITTLRRATVNAGTTRAHNTTVRDHSVIVGQHPMHPQDRRW